MTSEAGSRWGWTLRPSEGGLWLLAAWLVGLVVLFSRSPSAILSAQFWAEDGKVWFAQAYNLGGLAPLLRTQDGYFQTLPKLCADLALLVPLRWAPLLLNLLALAIQAVPVVLLLARRSKAWGGTAARVALAVTYLMLPNCDEISGTITNSQWILVLCAFLVLAMEPSRSRWVSAGETGLLALCGLTGPFCLFLAPLALVLAGYRRGKERWLRAVVLCVAAVVQVLGLMDSFGNRPHPPLGASFGLFLRIMGGHVFLPALVGTNLFAAGTGAGGTLLCGCACAVGLVVILFCLRSSPLEMKLFVMLSVLLLAAGLLTPATFPEDGSSAWRELAEAGSIRYWYFPTLAFIWSLVWGVWQLRGGWRMAALGLMLVMSVGVVRDWVHPGLRETGYATAVRRFEQLPRGSHRTLPLNPDGWSMELIKR